MRSQALIALSSILVATALVACAGASSSDEASADELNTSPAEAKACAVRAAYLGASLADFTYLSFANLPAAAQSTLTAQWSNDPFESVSSFLAPNVGTVYVTEQATAPVGNQAHSTLQFFATNGAQLAAGSAYNSWIEFSLSYTDGDAAANAVLRCGATGRDASARDASPWGFDATSPSYPDYDASYPYPDYDASYYPSYDASSRD